MSCSLGLSHPSDRKDGDTVDAHESFQQGRLQEAIATAIDEVRKRPTEPTPRIFLSELLCFTADLEKADRQLDVLTNSDPETAMGIRTFRLLVRAEQARRDFYASGRVPEFLVPPGESLRLHLEASLLIREGNLSEASGKLNEAEALRPRLSGTSDGQPFEDLRDLDDLIAPVLEVLTSDGRYLWLPFDLVASVAFTPPDRPLDLIWRRARLVAHDGLEGDVFLPALYPHTFAEPDDPTRLGRATDWRGGDDSPVRGVGQRMLMVGEDAVSFLELKSLKIDPVAGSN